MVVGVVKVVLISVDIVVDVVRVVLGVVDVVSGGGERHV